MYILLCRVYMLCPKSDIAPEYAKHSVRYIKKNSCFSSVVESSVLVKGKINMKNKTKQKNNNVRLRLMVSVSWCNKNTP